MRYNIVFQCILILEKGPLKVAVVKRQGERLQMLVQAVAPLRSIIDFELSWLQKLHEIAASIFRVCSAA
jgi:hypothetical protein